MYERIVVGTDGSQQALDAVHAAGKIGALSDTSTIHVVAAGHPYSALDMARIRADLPEEYHDLVNPQLEANEHATVAQGALPVAQTVVPHVMSGDAASSILTIAENVDADLIVVGARGLGAIQRFVRGSVSTKVAHHSPCDVLIVEHDD